MTQEITFVIFKIVNTNLAAKITLTKFKISNTNSGQKLTFANLKISNTIFFTENFEITDLIYTFSQFFFIVCVFSDG